MTITNEIEVHPFAPFVPQNARILIIGSFPGQNQNQPDKWFYSADNNLFWDIISAVYNVELKTIQDKKNLFTKHGIAITDIFSQVRRLEPSNLDKYLAPIEYNEKAIQEILNNNSINQILFTSKFVEKHFKLKFPNIENGICLPSPSQAANRSIARSPEYKAYNPEKMQGKTFPYRVLKYKHYLQNQD